MKVLNYFIGDNRKLYMKREQRIQLIFHKAAHNSSLKYISPPNRKVATSHFSSFW